MGVERSAESMVGRRLGEFVLRERIGQGGFGVVYRAEQPLLDREAVVKILHAQLLASAAGTQRFLREARLASRLDHPYAAHIYASGAEPDGTHWIAMEMVRGTPLDLLLRSQGPLPLERFLPLIERICEVVHTAHQQGIVHRDLKPANVMVLARAGRLLPKLLDFGIAKGVAGAAEPTAFEVAPRSDGELGDTVATAPPSLSRAVTAVRRDPDRTLRQKRLSPFRLELAETSASDPSALRPTPAEGGPSLTHTGILMGSPPYMAPEQWLDPSNADARTDLYALGVLCYEALTGRLPFAGDTAADLEHAHAAEPVPPLGDPLPPALDEVIARALAKDPADRHASALELASAFRAASGLAAEPIGLPALEESVRDGCLASAPHPVAEAIALFEAARNAHQARDALGQLVRTLVRVIGLYALAARDRIGAQRESTAVSDALRAMYRRPLSDQEWVDLGRELCRDLAGRSEVHPIPELVELYFPRGGTGGGTADRLGELIAATAPGDPSEQALLRQLEGDVASVSRVLGSLSFLREYALVVSAADGMAERWMGVRRSARTPVAVRGRPIEPGRVLLLDRDGCPVLALEPLIAVSPPAPGAPPEMFLFEGRGRRGARLVALPRGFERHDEEAWSWFRAHAVAAVEEAAEPRPEDRAPYPGLAAFSAEDAAVFVGREETIDAVVNRLQVQPFLAVVGRSGAGKSSFVEAGVVPALPAAWRHVSLRPGAAPLATLWARLRRLGVPIADDAPPDRAADRLRAAAAGGPILVVIDQLEELFTQCADPAERTRFAAALAAFARSPDDPVRVVVTLRDDFLLRAEELPGLRDRLAQGLQLLVTPAPADLRRILVEPARRLGFDFEGGDALPDEMVAEVADQPGALALLSFTMAALWERRDRHFRQLTRRAYRDLGGVAGALAGHAESTLSEMGADEQRLVREAFRQLVTAEGTRAALSRQELLHLLGDSTRAEAVLERLIAARLLVASEVEEGDRIEIIHETLLEAWPRLVTWRREDAEGARLRDQLRQAARQWEERGRPRGLLWRDEALADYQRWRSRTRGALTASESAFGSASLGEARRVRRVRRSALAIAFAALAAAVAVLAWMNGQTRSQRARADSSAGQARHRLVTHYQEQGRVALLADQNDRALVYLAEAYRLGARNPALEILLSQATRPFEARLMSLEGHGRMVWIVAFSPDGARLLTAAEDGGVRLWDASGGRLLHVLEGHRAYVYSASFSVDGARVVTGSFDGSAAVWDAATGRRLSVYRRHGDKVSAVAFSPDARRVVSAAMDGTAHVWDAASGEPIAELERRPGSPAEVSARAAFGPGGARVATTAGEEVSLWDARSGDRLASLEGHAATVAHLAFSPDGGRLMTVSGDRTAKIWQVPDGRLLQTLVGHSDRIDQGEWSGDGRLVVTASRDRTARIWDAATGSLVTTLEGHTGQIFCASFDADAARVATGSRDATARIWEVATGARLETFSGHTGAISRVDFSPDGSRLATASWDGTAKIWSAAGTGGRGVREGGPLEAVAVSPDGRHIALASADRVRVRTVSRGEVEQELAHGASWLAWGPDGRELAVAAPGGGAELWSLGEDRPRCAVAQGAAGMAGALARDGTLAIATRDGTIRTFRGCQPGASFPGGVGDTTALAFGPVGDRLLVAGEKGAVLRDPLTGASLVTLKTPPVWVLGAALSRDGRRIGTAHQDGVARLWSADSGEELGVLEGHTQAVQSIDFSADGVFVATGGYDRSVRLWDAARHQLLSVTLGFGDTAIAGFAGDLVVAVGRDGSGKLVEIRRERRTPDEIIALAKCRVPRRLEEENLVPAPIDERACADLVTGGKR